MTLDPKALAQRKFSAPDMCVDVFDIIERYASDPPQITRTLLEAVRTEEPGQRICELGFGTGWLLEEMQAAFPDAKISGLDLQQPAELAAEARDHVRAELVRRAEAWLARDGEIRIRRHGGAFIGHKEASQ